MKRLVLLLFLLSIFCSASHISAQDESVGRIITLANKGIDIGGDRLTFPNRVNIYGYDGIYMSDNSCWLRIDFKAPQIAISGSGNKIKFYDNNYKLYNSIRCSYFNTMSDSCLKHDVRPLAENESLRKFSAMLNDVAVEKTASSSTIESDSFIKILESNFPTLVRRGDDGTTLVNYVELLPLIVRQIQDAEKELEEICNEVELLKSEI